MARRKRFSRSVSGLSLADLRRMLDEKQNSLTTRRAALATELAAVDAEIAAAGGAAPAPTEAPKAPARRGRPPKSAAAAPRRGKRRGRKAGAKGHSVLHEAIRAALGTSSEPMRIPVIEAKVLASGYETKSARFAAILGQRLVEMSDVVKPGRGLYALKG